MGMSLREVARHVGVTHAAAYHHFANKEALVLAVADDGYARLLAAIRESQLPAPFSGPLSAFFRIIAVGVEYVRFAIENPSRFRFMYGTPPAAGDVSSPILARQGEVLATFAGAVAEAQREQVIAGRNAGRIGAQMWAQVHGLAALTVAGALDGVPRGSARKQSAGARHRRALDLARGAMVGFVVGARPQDPEWRVPAISVPHRQD